MAKTDIKVQYVCRECGKAYSRPQGKCFECGNFGTVDEEIAAAETNVRGISPGIGGGDRPKPIDEVDTENLPRFSSGISELDRVLGTGMYNEKLVSGIVHGSYVLLGGDPGIGKSTLILQMAHEVAKVQKRPVLYVSGEESPQQLRMRADRMGTLNNNLLVVAETNITVIEAHVQQYKPIVLIIDSIQTVFDPQIPSAPGSVSQVRECGAKLLRLAKHMNVAVFIIGHVTKEGTIAGPRVLEHMVDTVLYFEGDRSSDCRILRTVKNRFGAPELGVFEHCDSGLREVTNPSELFLAGRPVHASGSVVVPIIEGLRPLLVEVQALICATSFPNPRRRADGVTLNRVELLMAVMEKRVGMQLSNQDGYINITGGINVRDDKAIDLALAVAVASSFRDVAADPKCVVMGEVGMAGEVRAVSRFEQRIKEAEKIGFTRAIVPKNNLKNMPITKIKLIGVETVFEALTAAIGVNDGQ